jgi:glutathione S-transferase
MQTEVTIGYWDIRGFAEPLRLLAEYCGVKYNQKKYSKYEEWQADKLTLGADFPNLPYLIDGDKKLTESDAIGHYIALKSGHKELLGKTDDDIVKLALVRGVYMDARTAFLRAVYSKEFDSTIEGILTSTIHPKLAALDKHMGSGEGLTGTGLTYIDFFFYEFIDQLLAKDKTILDKYTNLKKLHAHIENLPAVAAYKKSDRYQARPFNFYMASFNPQ